LVRDDNANQDPATVFIQKKSIRTVEKSDYKMCREQETYLVPKSTGTGRPKKRWKDGRNRNNYFMKMIIERM
jgi:hypothetical protein